MNNYRVGYIAATMVFMIVALLDCGYAQPECQNPSVSITSQVESISSCLAEAPQPCPHQLDRQLNVEWNMIPYTPTDFSQQVWGAIGKYWEADDLCILWENYQECAYYIDPIMASLGAFIAPANNGISGNTSLIPCYPEWLPVVWFMGYVSCGIGPDRSVSGDRPCVSTSDQDEDGVPYPEDCDDYNPFRRTPSTAPYCGGSYPDNMAYDFNCNYIPDAFDPPCNGSPIVIDINGDDISLTSNQDGVYFDLDTDGIKERISWTREGVDDAWLCLDRNGNGKIDDGGELFGSWTPQPIPGAHELPNGFLALSVYDQLEKGGNNNGVIDPGDNIYKDLLIWRDINHNGKSEQNEIGNLESYGDIEINLDYKLTKKVDEFGNQLRYQARVKSQSDRNIGKWAWDVLLIY